MIELKGISRAYCTGKVVVPALKAVDLTVETGEFVAITGPSGSGKSTLLHVLGFLDRPDSGTYKFRGKDVTKLNDDELAFIRNRFVGFVFQQFHLLARASALENVALPMIYGGHDESGAVAEARLAEVGLLQRRDHCPNELSGGEQQRVAIARALVNDPALILADEPTGNLDSRSAEEIIAILAALHRRGKTIVMVTHEGEIARRAGRLIHMRDGRIVDDVVLDAKMIFSSARQSVGPYPVGTASNDGRQRMRVGNHFRQALRSILAHKLRATLSMLGILIGVAAVIAMLGVGQGARESVRQQLASLGSNLLVVLPGAPRVHGVALEGSRTRLTVEDARAVGMLPAVRRAAALVDGRAQVVHGDRNWNTFVQGAEPVYAQMHAAQPVVGRFFTTEEDRSRQRVAVVGPTIVEKLFNGENPVGRSMKINRLDFRVIGVLPPKGSAGWRDADDVVVIPLATAMYRVLGKDYVDRLEAEIRSPDEILSAMESIRKLLVGRHNISGNIDEALRVRDMTEIQGALSGTTRTMGWLLGSIAAISLLVGGIGIMNIMLVSVTERTREIGLRKAIGARGVDILWQFLIEAIVMTLTGGMMGIALGWGCAYLISVLAEWPVKISGVGGTVGVVFSAIVGVLFGLWPARQAAKLDPIQALRYE